MGILHKKVVNFNSTFSAVVIQQILIKYLLHASHDSLGHVGVMKLYHFIKRLYYVQGMRKKIYKHFRSCHKYQIMNLQKTHFIFIKLHQDIAQILWRYISLNLLGTCNITCKGNLYALNTVCNLTGYLMTCPIKDKKTMTVMTHLFSHVMQTFGFPRILHSENRTDLNLN